MNVSRVFLLSPQLSTQLLFGLGLFFLIIVFIRSDNYVTANNNSAASASTAINSRLDLDCSSMSTDLKREIANYSAVLDNITDLVLNGLGKSVVYQFLGQLVDELGPRFTGTKPLEDAIDTVVFLLQESNMENVHTENVTVPIWIRGNESLQMLVPRKHQMALLGLGGSVGTPPEGITAPVLVVKSFDELQQKASQVPGKIVVYNQPYISYGISVVYRSQGATQAAKYGAIATLVRSVTPGSIYSPHTGWQHYGNDVAHIPVACITVEDAELMQRITDRGSSVVVTLKMEAENLPNDISRNVISELTGRSQPDEVVIVSGHMDSWDVGQGAMDDGGGMAISLMAPYVIKYLGYRPRRTLRTVLWTAEEPGLVGAQSYRQAHQDELDKFNAVLESDEGTYDPTGFSFTGTDNAACILQEILKVTASLNVTLLTMPDTGSDTTVFSQVGIPTASLLNKNDNYFLYHHSNGDTMTQENSDSLDRCLVVWAFVSYVLADLSVPLPRTNSTTTSTDNNAV